VIILKDKPGMGRTVIEKFEQEAMDVGYAFVFLTAEDKITVGEDQSYNQARPNVLFELGWFYGRHGRNRVSILFKKGGKIHSDLEGINRIDFKDNIEEKFDEISNELKAAGLI
jgi:predicted nucleotide-binding protein